MEDSHQLPDPGASLYAAFRKKLEHEWKAIAFCRRHYYRSNDIKRWMLQQEPDMSITNGDSLLQFTFRNTLPRAKWEKISDCLIVFAILLAIDHGDLITIFQRGQILDQNLHLPITATEFQQDFTGIGKTPDEAKAIIERFEAAKWPFIPCNLKLEMQGNFKDYAGRRIMPFCKRQEVNHKGGTAQVYEASIPAALLPEELRDVIRDSEYEDEEYGKCSRVAVKSFGRECFDFFGWERDFYLSVKGKKGMVRYLGEYEIDEPAHDGGSIRTYNLLLEYGEQDLDEFFAAPDNYPPNMNAETIKFWKSFANVATAIENIHNFEIPVGNGEPEKWHGWHADLKPDNILRVHGEFKLADFGFAKFQQSKPDHIPADSMRGGTEEYGAPECDFGRRRKGTMTRVTQTIDTWSFGCVLSVSATWVVLGYQGVLAYYQLRELAIRGLRKRQANGESVRAPKADDAFHDGFEVIPQILKWHDYLKTTMRKSDTITGRILDLIENKMLLGDPSKRCSMKDLCAELESRLTLAESEYAGLVQKGDIQLVAPCVEEALLSVERGSISQSKWSGDAEQIRTLDQTHGTLPNMKRPDDSALGLPEHRSQSRSSLRSTRIHKPEKMARAVQGLVAHRADSVHSSGISIGTPSTELVNPLYIHGAYVSNVLQRHPATIYESPQLEHVPFKYGQDSGDSYTLSPPNAAGHCPSESSTALISRLKDYIPTETAPRRAQKLPLSLVGNSQGNVTHIDPITSQAPSPTMLPNPYGGKELNLSRPQDNLHSLSSSNNGPNPRGIGAFGPSPEWPICKEHDAIKKAEGGFRLTRRPQDKTLKDFLHKRDIKFLVDNDPTMIPYWDSMEVVLETLAKKVGPLDEDGLDLEFTVGSGHNAVGAQPKTLMKRFQSARQAASSRERPVNTDMAAKLSQIFDKYLERYYKKPMTLIVLTNGVWKGTKDSSQVERVIVDFLSKDQFKERLEKRWFTMEFISFGDDGLAMLKRLDDDLPKEYGIHDIIDTVSVSGDVYKMIIGSLSDEFDDNPDSPLATASSAAPSSLIPSATDSAYLQPGPWPYLGSPSRANLTRSKSITLAGLKDRFKRS